jgi:hypothetical protein
VRFTPRFHANPAQASFFPLVTPGFAADLALSLDTPDLLGELDRRFADSEGEVRWKDLRSES